MMPEHIQRETEKRVRLRRFKECFDELIDKHNKFNDKLFKMHINKITRICLKRTGFKTKWHTA